ncbi:uncharacterized protein [Pseudorca crassidens]|uniref:uncharacterized protein isoform X3 n=1 Tax=Pseudorca crassidens TaxID=82174 RepID=UPI00352DC65D
MATVTLWRARCILAASLDNPHANSLKNKGRGARDPRGRRIRREESARRRRRRRREGGERKTGVPAAAAAAAVAVRATRRPAATFLEKDHTCVYSSLWKRGVGIEALRMVDSAEKRSVIVFPEQPKALEVEMAGVRGPGVRLCRYYGRRHFIFIKKEKYTHLIITSIGVETLRQFLLLLSTTNW